MYVYTTWKWIGSCVGCWRVFINRMWEGGEKGWWGVWERICSTYTSKETWMSEPKVNFCQQKFLFLQLRQRGMHGLTSSSWHSPRVCQSPSIHLLSSGSFLFIILIYIESKFYKNVPCLLNMLGAQYETTKREPSIITARSLSFWQYYLILTSMAREKQGGS